jgi:hypothetical protein
LKPKGSNCVSCGNPDQSSKGGRLQKGVETEPIAFKVAAAAAAEWHKLDKKKEIQFRRLNDV